MKAPVIILGIIILIAGIALFLYSIPVVIGMVEPSNEPNLGLGVILMVIGFICCTMGALMKSDF